MGIQLAKYNSKRLFHIYYTVILKYILKKKTDTKLSVEM